MRYINSDTKTSLNTFLVFLILMILTYFLQGCGGSTDSTSTPQSTPADLCINSNQNPQGIWSDGTTTYGAQTCGLPNRVCPIGYLPPKDKNCQQGVDMDLVWDDQGHMTFFDCKGQLIESVNFIITCDNTLILYNSVVGNPDSILIKQ